MDKVSIIVPIYNVARYLDECIISLRSQTYSNLEIILVNDGSTDSGLEICQKIARSDTRIVVINQSNFGHGPALNAGLRIASGKYVMFCDGDDFYFQNMVELMVYSIRTSNADLATCAAYAFDAQTLVVSNDPSHGIIQVPYSPSDCLNKRQILKHAHLFAVQYWAKIYSLPWLKKNEIMFPNRNMKYDDVPFHWHVLAKASTISLVRAQLYGYRINRPGSSYSTIDQNDYLTAHVLASDLVERYEPRLLMNHGRWWVEEMLWLQKRQKLAFEVDKQIKTYLCKMKVTYNQDGELCRLIDDYLSNRGVIQRLYKRLRKLYDNIAGVSRHPNYS